MQVADRLIGYLVVESATHGFFTADHADRLGAIADQAGAALSNSQLARRVSELAATEERQRLARDLHDAVNQTLWTAALTAESLLNDIDADSELFHRADRLRQLNRGALAEMRSLLLELRPDELADVDLAQLITHLLDALECRRTLDVTAALDPVRLDPDVHVAFYRIAQESLGNVAQHANSRSLAVRLVAGPPVELCIADDGAGFDPDAGAGRPSRTQDHERACASRRSGVLGEQRSGPGHLDPSSVRSVTRTTVHRRRRPRPAARRRERLSRPVRRPRGDRRGRFGRSGIDRGRRPRARRRGHRPRDARHRRCRGDPAAASHPRRSGIVALSSFSERSASAK